MCVHVENVCVRAHVHVFVSVETYIGVCVCACVSVYVCVCMCVCLLRMRVFGVCVRECVQTLTLALIVRHCQTRVTS